MVVAVQQANGEIGVLQDLQKLRSELHMLRRQCWVVDAVQSFPWIQNNPDFQKIDFLVCSSHKCGGPRGIAALYSAKQSEFLPSPSLAAPHLFAGFSAAVANLQKQAAQIPAIAGAHRNFEAQLKSALPETVIFAEHAPRLPSISAFALPVGDGAAAQIALDLAGIAISLGTACSSGTGKPSRILQAMDVNTKAMQAMVRISSSFETEKDCLQYALQALLAYAQRVQKIAQARP